MKSNELVIQDPELMSMIHKIYPKGVKYATDVMDLALKLSEVSETLYNGAFFNDYGIYPFLNVDEAHLENANLSSKHIIVESEFDKDTFSEFVTSLSISTTEIEDIIKDVNNSYYKEEGSLDTCYLLIMRYLIEYLKCIVQRRDTKKVYMEAVFDTSIGYSSMITLNSVMTLPYIRRSIKKYNQKQSGASGKWFRIMVQNPERLIVSCEKYISK
ncbi:hypothetical protein [Bacteroides thetaiotaomicron]|jgi:hypothetical protein|uniref:hypothetical protein n=1 Tax=Bacteroides thetaiotaomicron TaxID=818 RepID=UPI0022E67DF5|nr:hypothetical protein [Bacteroides thetaiotaomicron]